MELDNMPGKWGQQKWAVTVTHQERWAAMVTIYNILASRLSGQQLFYSRGSGDVPPHNMLSGA